MLSSDGQNNKKTMLIRPLVLFVLLLSTATFNPYAMNSATAGFSTNFSSATFRGGSLYDTGSIICAYADPSDCQGQVFANGDPTVFAMQTESINGTVYWHVIVGDPATGFAQESYTRYGANPGVGSGGGSTANGLGPLGAYSPDSGGNENLANSCALAGACLEEEYNLMAQRSDNAKPLAGPHISGNGTGNPSFSVFHMILVSGEGDMSLEVDKPFLDTKPRISQTVQDGAMTSTFVTDMRKLSYSEANDPAPVINDFVMNDPTIPGSGAANFTMDNSQHSIITSGRFTYTPGTGWNSTQGWDAPNSSFGLGTYSYYGSVTGYDVYSVDWTEFFDYGQNQLNCTREGAISTGGGVTGVATRNSMGQGGGFSCPGHP